MTTTDRILILLRHAKSDWSGSLPDVDRPLADRGKAQAPLAGQWLANRAGRIDLALVSPARRARETWELVSAHLEPLPPARFEDRVYAASADQLLDIVHDVPDTVQTVLIVGHNPGMEQLASRLAGAAVVLRASSNALFDGVGPGCELAAASAALRVSGRSDGHDLR